VDTRAGSAQVAAIVREMVRRIVERFAPERVIVFGSQAVGTAQSGSDADLLVVMHCSRPPHEEAVEIRKVLADLPMGQDVVVVTPEYFERYRDIVGTVVWPAVRQGKLLCARRA